MTRDDIIRMAREAGIVPAALSVGVREADMIALERFAALVAATERKACAKVCSDWGMEKVLNWQHDPEMRNDAMARAHDAECCAALILKRGDHVITGSAKND